MLRQEDSCEVQASLDYTARQVSKKVSGEGGGWQEEEGEEGKELGEEEERKL